MTPLQERERRATEYRVKVYRRTLRRRARRSRMARKALTATALLLLAIAAFTMTSAATAENGSTRLLESTFPLVGEDIHLQRNMQAWSLLEPLAHIKSRPISDA